MMASAPITFERPPVTELVCGVQFQPLADFRTIHFGQFATVVRGEYPNTEDQSPLSEIVEQTDGTTAVKMVRMQTDEAPPLRRVWFIDDAGHFVIQVQPSRFLSNWRKMSEEVEYPRFDKAYTRFVAQWERFVQFCRETGLGTPNVNQYELSYINHVVAEGFPSEIGRYFRPLSFDPVAKKLPPATSAGLRLRFPMPPNGAMHVNVKHGRLQDDREALVIELTARGPGRDDCSDMGDWFGRAHDFVLRAFCDLTTEEAHRLWGRVS